MSPETWDKDTQAMGQFSVTWIDYRDPYGDSFRELEERVIMSTTHYRNGVAKEIRYFHRAWLFNLD